MLVQAVGKTNKQAKAAAFSTGHGKTQRLFCHLF